MNKVYQELTDFISRIRSQNTEQMIVNALLASISNSSLESGPAYFDHRHLFKVSIETDQPLNAAFIASPFLPSDWRSRLSLADVAVCTSGIAQAAATKVLRTTFNCNAGVHFNHF